MAILNNLLLCLFVVSFVKVDLVFAGYSTPLPTLEESFSPESNCLIEFANGKLIVGRADLNGSFDSDAIVEMAKHAFDALGLTTEISKIPMSRSINTSSIKLLLTCAS
ncbi:MAG: hypothetical protein ACI9N3_000163 [Colwellia sp.]|jgi:hypothetical protein